MLFLHVKAGGLHLPPLQVCGPPGSHTHTNTGFFSPVDSSAELPVAPAFGLLLDGSSPGSDGRVRLVTSVRGLHRSRRWEASGSVLLSSSLRVTRRDGLLSGRFSNRCTRCCGTSPGNMAQVTTELTTTPGACPVVDISLLPLLQGSNKVIGRI